METENKYQKQCKAAYDNLIKAQESIELHKMIVLTGSNASGKSLLRRTLMAYLRDKTEFKNLVVSEWSLATRNGLHTDGLDFCRRDVEWMASSTETFNKVEYLMNNKSDERRPRFLVFDEPEVGMSDETTAGLALVFNEHKEEMLKNTLGCIIITHSKELVSRINDDIFINLNGMTKEEWLNREIKPISPKEVEEFGNAFYQFMEDHLQTVKNEQYS